MPRCNVKKGHLAGVLVLLIVDIIWVGSAGITRVRSRDIDLCQIGFFLLNNGLPLYRSVLYYVQTSVGGGE